METQDPAPQEERDRDEANSEADALSSSETGDPTSEAPLPEGASEDSGEELTPTEAQNQEVDVRGVELGEIPDDLSERVPATEGDVGGNLEMLLDIPMPVSVEVGRAKVLLEEVLQMGAGFVLRLDKKVGEPVDLMVNGKRVAEGEVVAVDEQLGIRITRVIGIEGSPPGR